MTYKNNFDTNSQGQDIELNCAYDTGLSRIYFDESFEILQCEGYRTNSILYYTDYGSVPDASSITFEVIGSRKDKIDYLVYYNGYNTEHYSDWTIEELDSEILYDVDILNYKRPEADKITIKPSKPLNKIAVRGYSQGDYVEVIYCPDDIEKAWGKKPSESELETMFERLCFDCPIHCVFTIDGNEFYYGELMPDMYEWQPEKFAEIVSKESGVNKATLLDILPEYPDYN